MLLMPTSSKGCSPEYAQQDSVEGRLGIETEANIRRTFVPLTKESFDKEFTSSVGMINLSHAETRVQGHEICKSIIPGLLPIQVHSLTDRFCAACHRLQRRVCHLGQNHRFKAH